jgi:hypothetical protein
VGLAADAKVSVMDSELAENQAESGGAISTWGGCNLIVHGSSFAHNNASYGGGLLADELSRLSLNSCMLESNTAVGGGGALQARAQTQVGGAIGQATQSCLQNVSKIDMPCLLSPMVVATAFNAGQTRVLKL